MTESGFRTPKACVYVTIDTNDRFEFFPEDEADKDEGYEPSEEDKNERLAFLEGTQHHQCVEGGWNYIFVEPRPDGIYYNGRMVFSIAQFMSFQRKKCNNRDDDDSEYNVTFNSECDCPKCEDASKQTESNDWYHVYDEHIWLYAYTISDTNTSTQAKDYDAGVKWWPDDDTPPPAVRVPDGIEFKDGDIIHHIGRENAHVHLKIPLEIWMEYYSDIPYDSE
jgi:hypothetical protein